MALRYERGRFASGLTVLRTGLVLGLLLGAGLPAAGDASRVAVVKSGPLPPFDIATDAIVDALRADTLDVEPTTFDLGSGSAEETEEAMRAVARLRPRLVVTVGSVATAAVLEHAGTAPVVFSMVLYPHESGFVPNAGRPVTGASLDLPLSTQFAMLRRLLPSAHKVGVLYHAAETGPVIAAAREEAPRHGFVLEAHDVGDAGSALAALGELMNGVDVVWAVADGHVFTPQTTSPLILAALRRRMPLIGLSAAQVRSGALAALTCDFAEVGRQSATLALRVLRGENAAALPVTQPHTVGLALSLRTAKHIGLSIGPDLVQQAHEVVQ